jgi:hypothetical protein
MTAGTLGDTPAGGIDGFLTRFDSAGNNIWLKQFGTPESDEAWALAVDADGNIYLTGYTAGSFSGQLAGDKDIIVARVDPDGVITWRDQFGTTGNDKGAGISLDESGSLFVAGFTDGPLETSLGKFDAVLAKYAPNQAKAWTRQFGTTEDDGADSFAEANLFSAAHDGTAYVSGLTAGDTASQPRLGNGDVFLTSFDGQGAEH